MAAPEPEAASSPEAILTQGIVDVSSSLMGETFSLNDTLRMILEVIYRAKGFTRVLFCIKNAKKGTIEGRYGFGNDVNTIIKSFSFPLGELTDVFNMALSRDAEMIIHDINDPRVKSLIPGWYRDLVREQTFLLLPISLKKVPIGLIYADKSYPGGINLPSPELSSLKHLRQMAQQAIQRSISKT